MNPSKQQRGFSLLELSIVVVIMGMMILGWIQLQSYQNQRDKARSVAQIYETMNQAAGSYMVNYYPQIIEKNGACANLPVRGQNLVGVAIPAPPPGCGGTLVAGTVPGTNNPNNVPVANLRQPTLAELRALGLLDINPNGIRNNVLPLPTFTGLNHPWRILNSQTNQVAPAAFHILIQNTNNNNIDLRSIVFNLQPFNLQNNNFGGNSLLDQIALIGGANTLVSDQTNQGELRPTQPGEALVSIVNPISVAQDNTGALIGAPNIIAMRNGYGSSGFARYLRRDGSTPLTGNWSVGNRDITDISNLGVNQNITAGGNITGQNLNALVGVDAQGNPIGGQVSGATGVFGAVTNPIVAALKATTAYVQDTLTVGAQLLVQGDAEVKGNTQLDGTLNVGGPTTLNTLSATGATTLNTLNATGATTLNTLSATGATDLKDSLNVRGATTLNTLSANRLDVTGLSRLDDVSVDDFQLRQTANINAECQPATHTIARNRNQADSRDRLLYCVPGANNLVGLWRPAIDVAADLSNINSNINTINTNIGNINTNIGAINSNLTTVTNQVNTNTGNIIQLKNQELKWDIVQFNWRPADVIRAENGGDVGFRQAKDKVWRRTPWRCNRFDGTSTTPVTGEGGLDPATWGDQAARYLENASDRQSSKTFTPPLLVSFDRKPDNDVVVWHINCGTPDRTGDSSGSYWYIGASSKKENKKHGNGCRDGLGSTLTANNNFTYTHNPSATCNVFNIFTPSFNTQNIVGRWIAFTRPNDDGRADNGVGNTIDLATNAYIVNSLSEIDKIANLDNSGTSTSYFYDLTAKNTLIEVITSDGNWRKDFRLSGNISRPDGAPSIPNGTIVKFRVNSTFPIFVFWGSFVTKVCSDGSCDGSTAQFRFFDNKWEQI